MKRYASLLILGRNYPSGSRFPRCDATWATLSTVNDDKAILQLPNLKVWDCGHDIENMWGVDVYDYTRESNPATGKNPWLCYLDSHGRTFANQYCWMLADVSGEASPFASVTLFGMNMIDEEYIHELQYITYHLGYLRALGVGITICDPSAILRPFVYGFGRGESNV